MPKPNKTDDRLLDIFCICIESFWTTVCACIGILSDHQCQWFMTVLAYWQSHESASCLRLISPDVHCKSFWVVFQHNVRRSKYWHSQYKHKTVGILSCLDNWNAIQVRDIYGCYNLLLQFHRHHCACWWPSAYDIHLSNDDQHLWN